MATAIPTPASTDKEKLAYLEGLQNKTIAVPRDQAGVALAFEINEQKRLFPDISHEGGTIGDPRKMAADFLD